jgi:putative ABC transport system substrate-binding protein
MKSADCEAVYVLGTLAIKFGLPAIYQIDYYVQIGGLMSYGPDFASCMCVPLNTWIAS